MKEITNQSRARDRGSVDPVMVIGMLLLGRGVGNVISGPLSSALVEGMPWMGQAFGGYGSGYGPLIVYSGLTGLLSGSPIIWRSVGLL